MRSLKKQPKNYGAQSNAQPAINQIYLVTFSVTKLTQASFLQKNQISVILRWHRASVAGKNQSF